MHSAISNRLNKNHDICRDLCLNDQNKLFRFDHCADTAGAQCLSDFTTIFEKTNLLQVGFEFSISRSHGKTAIMSEGCCFSTFFTLCHNKDPFNYACFYFAGLGTAQQSKILPQPVTFYKKSVYERGITR